MAFVINGPNKLISLTAGTETLSVVALYSAWIDWVATSDNAKFLPAFRTVGGDDVDAAAGTKVPAYCFLTNGWRVRPQEAHHTLKVTEGILLVDGGGDPFVNTLGNFVVRVNYSQPVQAITVSTGGGGGTATVDPAEIATAVRAALAAELALIDRPISSRVAAGDMVAANVLAIRGQHLSGDGTGTNPWRPG